MCRLTQLSNFGMRDVLRTFAPAAETGVGTTGIVEIFGKTCILVNMFGFDGSTVLTTKVVWVHLSST